MKIRCWKNLFVIGILTTSFASMQAEPLLEDGKVQEQRQDFSTYFSYKPSEIRELSEKNSNERMSNEELMKWDDITVDLSRKNPGSGASRMYAYLYTAQKEAAFLSYNSHGQFMGSVGPISEKVLKLFFPGVPHIDSDIYSESLAEIVFAKIKQRFDDESAEIRNFPLDENDPKLKEFPKPYVGLKTASCKPWLLKDPKQFMASRPPSQNDPYWMQQSEVVKQIAENVTEKQMKAVKFWAGESGPKSGNWMEIINEYMFSHDVPFSKIVCVRSVLAQAGIDIDIPLFYTKYTYLIKRPAIVNPTIHQHIEFPKHPSYPSGHSTWSSACATILTYYFPKEKDHWFEVAEEAGLSRIWGGIHYPIDHRGGWILGTHLGNMILQSPKVCIPSMKK